MNATNARTGCEVILREYGDLMRIGTTKIFMKEVLEGKLADKRNQRLKEMAAKIQRRYRTYPIPHLAAPAESLLLAYLILQDTKHTNTTRS